MTASLPWMIGQPRGMGALPIPGHDPENPVKELTIMSYARHWDENGRLGDRLLFA